MQKSYWARTLEQRVSRRRALGIAAGTGAGLAALSLIGCGSDDDDGGGGSTRRSDSSGLVTVPTLKTDGIKKGGIWANFEESDTRHFDPLSGGSSQPMFHGNHVYQTLLRYKTGTPDEQLIGEVEGNAAESWELSDDGLTISFKLRQPNLFDPREPTSSRQLDAEDVKFSWDRFTSLSTSRGDFYYEASKESNPLGVGTAPVESIETPSNDTVVFHLAFPQGAILRMFAYSWYLSIMPREADGGFDPLKDMRGSGPWMLSRYQTDIGFEYRRNPNWFEVDKAPYLDGIDYTIVGENVQSVAQLKSGNLWSYGLNTAPPQEEVLTIKNENPEILLVPNYLLNERGSISQVVNFSGRPNSRLRDVRIRQAASMLFDRDLFVDIFYNVSGFADAGIDVLWEWNSHVPASWGPKYWIDPRTRADDLGEGAKYFQFDPEEAAKLLRAADAFGLEETFTYHGNRGGFGGVNYQDECQVMIDMLNAGGHFKLTPQVLDYFTDITPRFTFAKGDFDGITPQPIASYPDIDLLLWAGFTVPGRNAWVGEPIPGVQELLEQHRRELDDEKRFELLYEIQRKLAVEMPVIPRMGIAEGFDLFQPWLGNAGAIQVWNTNSRYAEAYPYMYYDESKRPT